MRASTIIVRIILYKLFLIHVHYTYEIHRCNNLLHIIFIGHVEYSIHTKQVNLHPKRLILTYNSTI